MKTTRLHFMLDHSGSHFPINGLKEKILPKRQPFEFIYFSLYNGKMLPFLLVILGAKYTQGDVNLHTALRMLITINLLNP